MNPVYHDAMMSAFVDEMQKMAAASIEKDAGLALLRGAARGAGRLLGRGGAKGLATKGVAQTARTGKAVGAGRAAVPTPRGFVPGRTGIPGFQMAAGGGRARMGQAALGRARQGGGRSLINTMSA